MTYDSEIQFTLDTICPWTYLAKRRLDKALALIREDSDSPVNFTVKFKPYQLYPGASQEGEDKYAWYRKSRYGDSDEKMAKYMHLMSMYGNKEGIDFKFGGTVANTLPAHRLIQHFQEKGGPEMSNAIVNSLYRQYFEEEKHPSAHETLLTAAKEAGIDEAEAKKFLEDEDEGLRDVKMLIREQAGNGIDAVPYIVIEGKRRDITIEGAKEVEDFVKALKSIIKESS
ncbi:hypothetical protein CERZMDRAFT_105342 [Cercospora zeae-maydis SCOH1-5]|uniref:DSBA-like thioredoxin domain-containing protein n=1 Tax=Cercospora zeae-maydis SCOH1-5 TaxID=717836 RepID=A0A6A6FP38_9PEZI|nr:hypothetical protein CERZMDRAFT_105342 [Cercospora zeae-maydis SCOH1-5]